MTGSDPGVQRWTVTVVCTSTAVLLINVAAPNVALGAIQRDLGASFTDLQLADLAGIVVAGVGVGHANPTVTFAHLGVLPPAQGGLASGINDIARQLGLAVGIAVLGAVLQSRIAGEVEQRTTGLGAARGAVTARIADGDVAAATRLAPAVARASLRSTYEAAFASGLNELLLISIMLALTGLAAALVLVRSRDLWQPG